MKNGVLRGNNYIRLHQFLLIYTVCFHKRVFSVDLFRIILI